MSVQYTFDGEHKYENLYLCKLHKPHILERIRAGYDLTGDVLLASYPKSGSTWMQELIWLLINNMNFEKAKQKPIGQRVPVIELTIDDSDNIDIIDEMAHPRVIKSHLPARFFQRQLATSMKVVLLIRNPKDQLVSMFHFNRMAEILGLFSGTWDDFFELYKDKHVGYGDWFDWYQEWLPFIGQENVKLIKYEDMVCDLGRVIQEVAGFLDKTVNKRCLDELLQHLSFEKMSQNDMVNRKTESYHHHDISPFMRKGIIGDWKNHFSEEQSEYVDAVYKQIVETFGVKLQFE